ncbi:T9SS type A sorting domain-containing protein [Hymenobacter swuensis]|uniref:T9SS type A sorting domain-containing protein n=1 Tax=Hymenobacter swuensis TaxID=1446467 RepID=UPI0005C7460B|nr:T9SS type A sorting domain-containing protein [Hymenobacter swuensis]
MTQLYKKGSTTTPWRKLAVLGLLGLASTAAHAQRHQAVALRTQPLELASPTVASRITALPYTSGRAQNVTSTYADLGTAGTAITTANLDDATSGAQDIGFSFSYNGTAFTQFTLNTNGFVKLGATAPTAANDVNILINNTDQNVLAPASGVDLVAAANQTASPTEFRVSTTGTAGSRVCTIQFKNLSDKPTVSGTTTIPSQFSTMQFQIKLYEGTNNIEFVYGAWTSSGNTATAQGFLVGLKGSSADPADLSLTSKGGTAAWSATTFQNTVVQGGVTYYVGHFVQNSVLPDAGRTYRFRTAPASDASVATIHTLGKLAVPNSLPHAVVAAVTNSGTNPLTNVPVTLTVSGANTFTSTKTIATLAAGATQAVTFDAYPTTLAQGTNNLTVTVPADDDNTNNSLPYTQQITTDQVAYVDAAQVFFGSVGVSSTTAGGTLAVKYKNSQAASLSQVKATFLASATTTSTYRVVVLDANGTGGTPGTVLYTSPVQSRPAAAGTVTIAVPNPVVSGDFYVGVLEVSGNVGIAYQLEDPLRTGTFYYQTSGGAWTPVNNTTLRTRLALDATLAPVPTCATPTAVAVSNITVNSASVTFTAPSNGTAYTVIYGPRGFNPATAGTSVPGTASPITLTGLTSGTQYDVYVRANCGATDQSNLSPVAQFTTVCQAPIITAFPYGENFDGVAAGTLPCGITVANENNDNRTWAVIGTDTPGGAPASAPNQLRYVYSATAAADDWFFTPALFLRAGSTYQVSFKYKAAVLGTSEKLEVKYGNAATAAGQTNLLWKNEAIANATYTTTVGGTATGQVVPITPATTGNYYVGFHVYSAADQYNLYIDDIAISTITASSPALMRAISLYPNPSEGSLTVEVSGANAKGGLQVEVINLLGQRVHTATVRDNMTNQVDLSKLSSGMYIVKVKNGNEYMMRNITIQK